MFVGSINNQQKPESQVTPFFYPLNIVFFLYIGSSLWETPLNVQDKLFIHIWLGSFVITIFFGILFKKHSIFFSGLVLIFWLIFETHLLFFMEQKFPTLYFFFPFLLTLSLAVGYQTKTQIKLIRGIFFVSSLIFILALQFINPGQERVFISISILGSLILLGCSQRKYVSILNSERSENRLRTLLKDYQIERAKLSENEKQQYSFLASFSHDLRQPIHAINLYISSMERMLIKFDTDSVITNRFSHSIRRIKLSVRYMNNILEGLLEANRIEQGVILPNLTGIDIIEFCKKIIAQHREDASELGLKLDFRYKEQDKSFLKTDSKILERVINNLISNGLKFTEKGGVRLRLDKTKNKQIISIIDTGQGIPHELQQTVFEEFSQIPGKTRSIFQNGSGLGLAISKKLISKIGGSLSLKSKPGLGSIFTLSLPGIWFEKRYSKAKAMENAIERSVLPQITLTDPRRTIVVLVDEDKTSRDAILALEPELNLRFVSGSSAAEIFSQYKEINTLPKMLIINTSNQNEKTKDTIKKISEDFNTTFSSILLCSDIETESLFFRELENIKPLQKPVSLNDLQYTISTLIEE